MKLTKKQLAILAAASAEANRTVMSQIVGENQMVISGVPPAPGAQDGVGGICKVCGNNMLRVDTCELFPVPIKNSKGKHVKSLKPIRFGQETRFNDGAAFGPNDRCHDCGVKVGGWHHPGCDMEECPGCHGQMLMCGGECGR